MATEAVAGILRHIRWLLRQLVYDAAGPRCFHLQH